MSMWTETSRGPSLPQLLARSQGVFNLSCGLWPLAHPRSFEAVFGARTDRRLVRTVAGLLVANGAAQLVAAHRGATAEARAVGIGTAVVLGTVDACYAPRGVISRRYLLDLAAETGWLLLWTADLAREARGVRKRFSFRADDAR